jgi:hypothetical protein
MQITKPETSEGTTVSARVGLVEIIVSPIRAGIYRVAVCYGSTGAEVPELSASYPTEDQARSVARNAYRAFAGGQTVASVLAALGFAPKAVEA